MIVFQCQSSEINPFLEIRLCFLIIFMGRCLLCFSTFEAVARYRGFVETINTQRFMDMYREPFSKQFASDPRCQIFEVS